MAQQPFQLSSLMNLLNPAPQVSDADRAREEYNSRMLNSVLSRSFLHISGEIRPVTRALTHFVVSYCIEQLDQGLLVVCPS